MFAEHLIEGISRTGTGTIISDAAVNPTKCFAVSLIPFSGAHRGYQTNPGMIIDVLVA